MLLIVFETVVFTALLMNVPDRDFLIGCFTIWNTIKIIFKLHELFSQDQKLAHKCMSDVFYSGHESDDDEDELDDQSEEEEENDSADHSPDPVSEESSDDSDDDEESEQNRKSPKVLLTEQKPTDHRPVMKCSFATSIATEFNELEESVSKKLIDFILEKIMNKTKVYIEDSIRSTIKSEFGELGDEVIDKIVDYIFKMMIRDFEARV
jgi:hypothetical protein